MSVPHSGLHPPLRGISLSGLGARTPGLPACPWCGAALQATRESLSWFASSGVGRAISQGGRCQESQVGQGGGTLVPGPVALTPPSQSLT